MDLTISSHPSSKPAIAVHAAMSAIHRRSLDVQRLGASLLVRVGCLGWRELSHLVTVVGQDHFLAAASEV